MQFFVYQWYLNEIVYKKQTNKLPSTWLRTKSLTLTVAQERNAHIYVYTVCRGVKLCPRKNQPFKYRCLIKVRSYELGFPLCYVRAFEPGSHHNQHVAAARPSLAYLRSCDYTDQKHLHQLMVTWFSYHLFSKLLGKSTWRLRWTFSEMLLLKTLKKKIPCQITLVWTGLGRDGVGTRS